VEKNKNNNEKKTSYDKELKDKFIRISADFENYKKRIENEKKSWIEVSQAEVLKDLLNIVDDFDRAIDAHKKKISSKNDTFLEGLELINKSFHKILEKYNVKEITNIEKFDPKYHEAIIQIESKDHENGEIVEILQKGYTFKDKLLRPAKVSVAK
jgi:molecular chaperone GrpE